MDLRSLDPFVLDPPGRKGNLYESFGPAQNFINEKPQHIELPSTTLCSTASTIGNNICFQKHIQKDPIIPNRFMQFDLNIEKLINERTPPNIQFFKKKRNDSTLLILVIIILILFYFA